MERKRLEYGNRGRENNNIIILNMVKEIWVCYEYCYVNDKWLKVHGTQGQPRLVAKAVIGHRELVKHKGGAMGHSTGLRVSVSTSACGFSTFPENG